MDVLDELVLHVLHQEHMGMRAETGVDDEHCGSRSSSNVRLPQSIATLTALGDGKVRRMANDVRIAVLSDERPECSSDLDMGGKSERSGRSGVSGGSVGETNSSRVLSSSDGSERTADREGKRLSHVGGLRDGEEVVDTSNHGSGCREDRSRHGCAAQGSTRAMIGDGVCLSDRCDRSECCTCAVHVVIVEHEEWSLLGVAVNDRLQRRRTVVVIVVVVMGDDVYETMSEGSKQPTTSQLTNGRESVPQ